MKHRDRQRKLKDRQRKHRDRHRKGIETDKGSIEKQERNRDRQRKHRDRQRKLWDRHRKHSDRQRKGMQLRNPNALIGKLGLHNILLNSEFLNRLAAMTANSTVCTNCTFFMIHAKTHGFPPNKPTYLICQQTYCIHL